MRATCWKVAKCILDCNTKDHRFNLPFPADFTGLLAPRNKILGSSTEE